MAVDDPPLPCIGSVHVPGCVHTGAVPPRRLPHLALAKPILEGPLAPAAGYAEQIAVAGLRELALTLTIAISRRGRRRCPSCRLRRELFAITAFAADQPVGYGEARCLECAGLRR